MGKQSHGTKHHADTTVVCPSCGCKFTHPHHAGVAEDWAEFIGVQFKSKQTEQWGVLRVPIELFSGATRAPRRGPPKRSNVPAAMRGDGTDGARITRQSDAQTLPATEN